MAGRRKGGSNRGYTYRSDTGYWIVTKTRRALLDEHGSKLRDKRIPLKVLDHHYRRQLEEEKRLLQERGHHQDETTVAVICETYLKHCKIHDAPATYKMRQGYLWDFCTGLPPSTIKGELSKKDRNRLRIHDGFGKIRLCDLRPYDITRWLDEHEEWNGARRNAVQAVKRAINYCLEQGLLSRSPIEGYKVKRPNGRITYFTPEQEEAIYIGLSRNPAYAQLIRVCIRTGARPISEYGSLEACHVEDHGNRMEWSWHDGTKVKGKKRVIKISEPWIIDLVRQQMKRYPSGTLFRNRLGKPWIKQSVKHNFRRLRLRLAKEDILLDEDACTYTCRHTFAKRILHGYWSGKPTNIETLAQLMGISRQVCWDYYARWCDAYQEPLWEALG